MNITIKYSIAVAAIAAATVFGGCGSSGDEIVPIEKADNGPDSEEMPADTAGEPSADGDVSKNADETGVIKVYVCGAVKNPDVYTVDKDCRTVDAIEAAGGAAPEAGLDYINLAAALSDGQKVYIPTKREIEEALAEGGEMYSAVVNITSNAPGVIAGRSAGGSEAEGAQNPELVNINSASKETLMTLPGIGESKADKIIAYREANGGFSSIEDIMLVGGIKEGLFNKVKDRICVR